MISVRQTSHRHAASQRKFEIDVIGARLQAETARSVFDKCAVALPFAAFSAIVLVCIYQRPVLPVDESRYLSVAWEMWRGGSMIVPHLNGADYADKPPLLFWLINFAWYVFGDDSVAARLVSPAFAALCIVLTARLYRNLWLADAAGGTMAAWILATTGVFLLFGSLTSFDAMLTASTLFAMISILRVRHSGRIRDWLLVAMAIAFGLLAKGPVIFLHVLPAALLMPAWAVHGRRPRNWYRGLTFAVSGAIGVAMLWLVPALDAGSEAYGQEILWHQHVGRIVSSFAHQEPVWFYLPLLPLLVWPWGWSKRVLAGLMRRTIWTDEGMRFCLSWLIGSLVALSLIGGKQIHYLLPEVPALAMLIARGGYSRRTPDDGRIPARPWLALLAPTVLLAAGALMSSETLVPAVAEHDLSVPLASVAAAAVILVALYVIVGFRGLQTGPLAVIGPGAVLMAHMMLSPVLYRAYDTTELAKELAPYEDQGIAIVREKYDGAFTYAGGLHRTVAELPNDRAISTWAHTHPGGAVLTRDPIVRSFLTSVGSFNFRGRHYRLLEVREASASHASASERRGASASSR